MVFWCNRGHFAKACERRAPLGINTGGRQPKPMGLRYLLLLLAIAGAVLIARHWLRSSRSRRTRPTAAGERMVRCAHCGVYLPESEALREDDAYFCSRRHLEARRADAG